jgi:MFS family permease
VSERVGIGILRPLRVRDFRLLWTGMFVSMAGDGIYFVAIAQQVFDLSDRASALAWVGAAWTTPQVVLMLASGVLSDRLDRRRLLIAGDLIRLVAIGTLGILSLTGTLTYPILLGFVAGYGVGQAIFGPAFSAIIPSIVSQDLLVQANSLGGVVRPFAMMVVGPSIGGPLVALIGWGWAFVLDAGTFAFSAVMILAMQVRREQATEPARSMRADLVEGISYVRRHAWLWAALVAATISLLCTWGPWESLVPYVIKFDLDRGPVALGLVFGSGGLGAVVAALIMGQRAKLPRRAITVMYVAWAIGMLMTAGFGLVTDVWQAMAVAFVAEAAISVLVVVWFTLMQRLVPDELLGRVSSLDWMISIAGVPLSFAIVGPLAEAIGVDATLILAGVLGAIVTLAFMYVPGAREPERDGSLLTRAEAAGQSRQ